ncbi:uncharacterized protein LOC112450753 [Kryptolebias marmoratus]|uniref:uncharacterized protein LOC112450753 n=1 Tax=Kryptolebias marmoratus TaxID=37003 RepID=UPI0018ACC9DE|nr:uncharacterized protein LOC112450753 [Kryptolebias marmoratus]
MSGFFKKLPNFAEEDSHSAIENVSEDSSNTQVTFNSEQVGKLIKLFDEVDVDQSGGLDVDEFTQFLHRIDSSLSKDSILALHIKIDLNCDGSVDKKELFSFLADQDGTRFKEDCLNPFFRIPSELIPVNSQKSIVKIACYPSLDVNPSDYTKDKLTQQLRPYQNCHVYMYISKDGKLRFSTSDFKKSRTICLADRGEKAPRLHHQKKMKVHDMVFMENLNELIVSTSQKEVLFYDCEAWNQNVKLKCCLVEEEITAMDCWSDKEKATLALGDANRFLYIMNSNYTCRNSFFNSQLFKEDFSSVSFSSLLKTVDKTFFCVKITIFEEVCSCVRYVPTSNNFAVCGKTSQSMIYGDFSYELQTRKLQVSKHVYKTSGKDTFITCAEFSPISKYLMEEPAPWEPLPEDAPPEDVLYTEIWRSATKTEKEIKLLLKAHDYKEL